MVTLTPECCGTAPTTRSLRGARPYSRVIARFTPDAAMHFKRSRSSGWISGWSSTRAGWTRSVSRSDAWSDCFCAASPGAGGRDTSWVRAPARPSLRRCGCPARTGCDQDRHTPAGQSRTWVVSSTRGRGPPAWASGRWSPSYGAGGARSDEGKVTPNRCASAPCEPLAFIRGRISDVNPSYRRPYPSRLKKV